MNENENEKKKKITFADFFCGIGGIRLGFERASKRYKCVYSNDIDEKCKITYEKNFPDSKVDTRSISDIDPTTLPDIDILTAGFPCQPFSIAGNKKGFDDDRGNLFFDIIRILKVKKPKCIFLENVKNLKTHDKGNTFRVITSELESLGFSLFHKVMNTKDYCNIPQNRERIYIIGFRKMEVDFSFPEQFLLTKSVRDFLLPTVPEKYFYTEKSKIYPALKETVTSQDCVYQYRRHYVRENKSGDCPTLTANMGCGGHNVPIILCKTNPSDSSLREQNEDRIRKLTPRECFSLQGFPDDYILPTLADSHLYKQIGNSVTVPLITLLAEEISLIYRLQALLRI